MALADIEWVVPDERRQGKAIRGDEAFLASDRFEAALRDCAGATQGMETGGQPFAPTWATVGTRKDVALARLTGHVRPRPTARADALKHIGHGASELDGEHAQAR